jgi:hypothetical protein
LEKVAVQLKDFGFDRWAFGRVRGASFISIGDGRCFCENCTFGVPRRGKSPTDEKSRLGKIVGFQISDFGFGGLMGRKADDVIFSRK